MSKLKQIIFLLSLSFGLSLSLIASDFDVRKYGVKGDGVTLNTTNIQKVIDKLSKHGGGRIIFPEGTYLTGGLLLKSNVTICLQKGAVLLGSTNPNDYYPLTDVSDNKENTPLALLMAGGSRHITLEGEGTIDGQGLALALAVDSLHHKGIKIDPKYNTRRMRPGESFRPKLFSFVDCDGIIVKGLKLRNSASWGLSFNLCSHIVIEDADVYNRAYWNNDGIDLSDCRQVLVTRCHINAADDGICLKSHQPDGCNDSIRIEDCEVRSSASAVKFGTASWGGFKNITIERIKVYDTFRSAIAIESVDGADIDNVRVSHITAMNTGNALFIRLGHRDGNKRGSIKNVFISDVYAEVPFGRPDQNYDLRGPEVDFFHNPFPSSIVGISGNSIQNVCLQNIEIVCPGRATKGMAYIPLWRLDQVPEQVNQYPEFTMFGELPAWGFYIRHAEHISMNHIKLTLADTDYRPAIVLDDAKAVTMNGLSLPNGHDVVAVKNSTVGQTEHLNITNIK
jgi:hypothetical protein